MIGKAKNLIEPKVSIVFLNWNGKKDTIGLVESLKKMSYKNYHTIVVDNGSTDGIEKGFNKKYRNIATLIRNDRNWGEAEGKNIGIREALRRGSDYVLVMDNDMYVDKNFLGPLVDKMEKHPEVAVAGSKIYYADPKNVIWSAGCDYHFKGFTSRNQNEIDVGQTDKTRYVDAVDCVFFMRASVLREIGILRGKYFTMYDLTGWCLRASKKGYKSLYVPKSKVWHKVSATYNRNAKKKGMTLYYEIRNWLLCNRESESTFYFLWILFLQSLVFFLPRSALYIKNGQPGLIKVYIEAILDALRNKTSFEIYKP